MSSFSANSTEIPWSIKYRFTYYFLFPDPPPLLCRAINNALCDKRGCYFAVFTKNVSKTSTVASQELKIMISRLRLKYDGTPAETRYRLSAKRTSPFKSAGASVQSTTSSWGVRISGSNAGYTMFRGGVKGTGYPLHSPVSPSLPLLCITVCHHISTGLTESFCWHVYRNTESKTPSLWDVVRLG